MRRKRSSSRVAARSYSLDTQHIVMDIPRKRLIVPPQRSSALITPLLRVILRFKKKTGYDPLETQEYKAPLATKEPNASWVPAPLPPGRGPTETWPSLVLEAAISHLTENLGANADWEWRTIDPKREVHVVMMESIDQTAANVTFEFVVPQQPVACLCHGKFHHQSEIHKFIIGYPATRRFEG